ncbi:MAG: tyrosine-protein phosphatase [Flavobacteriaceae bacterium]
MTTVPKIEGSINFRSVAGAAGHEGRRIRPGVLYRCGSLEKLTDAGLDAFHGIGIGAIFDLRSQHEIATYPSRLVGHDRVITHQVEHNIINGNLQEVLKEATSSSTHARKAMNMVYEDMPFSFAHIFRELLNVAANSEGPILVNCMAGKDRTGLGIGMLLAGAGVSRDDIMADYMVTNDYIPEIRDYHVKRQQARGNPVPPDDVLHWVVQVHPEYLERSFDAIDAKYPDLDAYLREEVGVDDETLTKLRDRLLES